MFFHQRNYECLTLNSNWKSKNNIYITPSSFQVGLSPLTTSVRYFSLPTPKMTEPLHTPFNASFINEKTSVLPFSYKLKSCIFYITLELYLLFSSVVNFLRHKLLVYTEKDREIYNRKKLGTLNKVQKNAFKTPLKRKENNCNLPIIFSSLGCIFRKKSKTF